MGNSLNVDLTGQTVVLRASAMSPRYRDLRFRLFHVNGGFGAAPDTAGRALFGTFLSDGERARMSGGDVERIATEDDLCALLPPPEAEGGTGLREFVHGDGDGASRAH